MKHAFECMNMYDGVECLQRDSLWAKYMELLHIALSLEVLQATLLLSYMKMNN